ncbi:type II toxin-antitoxin system VapC family toxin [soil metagenome]
MILDTSAIVAILQEEPEAQAFAELIAGADLVRISVATVLEASLVVGPARQDLLDEFLAVARTVPVAIDDQQLQIARAAHLKYGRGSRSPARLNYGDCFAYALAIATDEPLLFKGSDFIHTDVHAAA